MPSAQEKRIGAVLVADEVWKRIEETALEVAALARELAGSGKDERD